MAHKYHLDPDRKVDASAPGLGNHHTLFDFETMSEYYAKAVYVDGTPEAQRQHRNAARKQQR